MKEPIYKIGDRVFHITPESDVGVVVDCVWSMRYKSWTYVVTFGHDKESSAYYEDELTQNKTF